ncbi:response regulator transcription factor [Nocardiopsis sp. NRRL B-16309]|uniref:response regulator transcription factor n=1 Tax=Nocardiopsis sp. NRRL B-16309 TaxID=1519494 RepID=UPI0018D024F9|nr:response regulator transcription factor [Nocardiopsis sp. NRRL B-16309]
MTSPRETARVLVVDDSPGILSMLTVTLEFVGFEVVTARTAAECLERTRETGPDVILLDVMLPDTDGFVLCRRLRGAGVDAPVLFLTARDTSEDKVRGLELGDDYVTKPFDLREVVARIRALLRRTGWAEPEPALRAAGLELDEDAHEVHGPGGAVRLSGTECRVLGHLMRNAGRTVSKEDLLLRVWGRDFEGDGGLVETYVYYLRRKLGDDGRSLIRTVRGVGYLLRA